MDRPLGRVVPRQAGARTDARNRADIDHHTTIPIPPKQHAGLLNDLLDDLAYIENRVKALSAKIEAIAKEDETICRLLSVPGIGPLGATALVAAAGDGKQFRKARDMNRPGFTGE
ncbi:IS110 family transposase (plasmid) [Pseudorhodobacter turbinis]|uniref:IS110 family transposase n=1 Tax=Pseudorhodobacter turbinis TaxID=2500533 RepID=A0A4P8EJU1_9RHOB|nr:IS110 family transposase [Pseudorhodobacter turbinis]